MSGEASEVVGGVMTETVWQKVHCPNCHKLGGKGLFTLLQMKCQRCKVIFEVRQQQQRLVSTVVTHPLQPCPRDGMPER